MSAPVDNVYIVLAYWENLPDAKQIDKVFASESLANNYAEYANKLLGIPTLKFEVTKFPVDQPNKQ